MALSPWASNATDLPPRRLVSRATSPGPRVYFVSYQLPELYAGIEHKAGTFSVQYPGANVPQAWAAGGVFHLLRTILGLQLHAGAGLNLAMRSR